MDEKTRQILSEKNPYSFILANEVKNENGRPMEFRDHMFLIDPYIDMAPRQVVRKCSQIGWSVLAINKSFWLANYKRANVIYTLPSKSIVRDFVTPKVDPIVLQNPIYQDMMGKTDSIALKNVSGRFVYFRGSWEETAAISISAHVLINDELDRSNQTVVRTYRTRLDDAKRERPDLGYIWQFSNPSIPGYGVDEAWQKSDQKHWFIKCSHCNYEWYMKWPENVNFETKEYICAKCHRVLSNEDRRSGRWVVKNAKAAISGYWINQMMASWIPASKIIEDSEGDQQVFHNFTLGEPYISADFSVTRDVIVGCLAPGTNKMTGVAMGVDNGVVKTVVIGNVHGIFKVYETKDWEVIEADLKKYNATMVIDALPYPAMPIKLSESYRGRVFIHYFDENKKTATVIEWGGKGKRNVVKSDRTKIIDMLVAELINKEILFNMTLTQLEQYISDWTQIYREVEINARGIARPVWKTIEGRRDHFCFVAGTKIKTITGDKNIEDIRVGDMVLTRVGYKEVEVNMVRECNTSRVNMSNGSSLIGTDDHPIFVVGKGFVPLINLNKGDIVYTCKRWKELCLKVVHIGSILSRNIGMTGFISNVAVRLKDINTYIKLYGKKKMGKYHQIASYTTRIGILPTISQTTLNALQSRCTNQIIKNYALKMIQIIGRLIGLICRTSGKGEFGGTKLRKGKNGTLSRHTDHLFLRSQENSHVLSVKGRVRQLLGKVASFVVQNVKIVGLPENTGKKNVYNLQVKDQHEYYANGALVSNCFATVYWRIALEKTYAVSGVVRDETKHSKMKKGVYVSPGGTVPAPDLDEIIKRATKGKRSWKTI